MGINTSLRILPGQSRIIDRYQDPEVCSIKIVTPVFYHPTNFNLLHLIYDIASALRSVSLPILLSTSNSEPANQIFSRRSQIISYSIPTYNPFSPFSPMIQSGLPSSTTSACFLGSYRTSVTNTSPFFKRLTSLQAPYPTICGS